MINTTLTITNRAGLHARSAAKLVEAISKYNCSVEFDYDEKKVDAKNILSIMLLAAAQGSEINVVIDGVDEEKVSLALAELSLNRFGEE